MTEYLYVVKWSGGQSPCSSIERAHELADRRPGAYIVTYVKRPGEEWRKAF